MSVCHQLSVYFLLLSNGRSQSTLSVVNYVQDMKKECAGEARRGVPGSSFEDADFAQIGVSTGKSHRVEDLFHPGVRRYPAAPLEATAGSQDSRLFSLFPNPNSYVSGGISQ